MLYTVLCYNSEKLVGSWTQDQEAAVMGKLLAVQEKLARKRKLGPVARLGPTTTARSLRKDQGPVLVTDGPFAETKEQILGFYVIDCDSQDDAIEFAKELSSVNPGGGYEIRPVIYFNANDPLAQSVTMPNAEAWQNV
jgi:hypothetical protein